MYSSAKVYRISCNGLGLFTVWQSYLFRLKERLCGVKASSPLCSENYVTSSVPFRPMELFDRQHEEICIRKSKRQLGSGSLPPIWGKGMVAQGFLLPGKSSAARTQSCPSLEIHFCLSFLMKDTSSRFRIP